MWRKKLIPAVTLCALLVFAASFIFTPHAIAQSTSSASEALGLNTAVQQASGLGNQDIRVTVAKIIRAALSLLGIVVLCLMLYAGYQWMTAGGNDEQIISAKSTIRNATIGLALILSAYAIVSFVINSLLGATGALPSHCFNGVQDADETGIDTGGSCGYNGGSNGGLTGSFYVVNLPSSGNACVANFHPVITFNRPVDLSTFLPPNIQIEKADNSIAGGAWEYTNQNTKNSVVFIPSGTCGVQGGNNCFDPNADYRIVIAVDQVTKTSNIKSLDVNPANALRLRCDVRAGCGPVSFRTGSGVDLTPPTIDITYPSQGQQLDGGGTIPVRINFTDDSGVQSIQLYNATGTTYGYGGGFAAPRYLAAAPQYSMQYQAVGDIDDDGKLDIVAGGTVSQQIRIYRGNGDGTFAAPATTNFGQVVYGIGLTDINGDGKLDIVAAGQLVLVTMIGNGDGTFKLPTFYNLPVTTRNLYVKDVNGDGYGDAVVLFSQPKRYFQVYINKKDGTFNAPASYDAGFNEFMFGHYVAAADFNKDSKTDLAVLDYAKGSVQFYGGRGDGTFAYSATTSLPLVGPGAATPYAMSVVDFNTDGKLDLAVADYINGSITLYFGNGDFTFGAPSRVAVNYANDVLATDLNNDGKLDIVVSQLNGYVTTFTNLGNNNFSAAVMTAVQPTIGTHSTHLESGDFNSDGLIDITTIFDDPVGNQSGVVVLNSNNVLVTPNYQLIDSVAPGNCQTTGTVQLAWPTQLLPGGTYTLEARAYDYAAQNASVDRTVKLRPGTCFNSVLDPNEEQVGPPACGMNSFCGRCQGSPCTNNSNCAGGFCVGGGGPGGGICINQAKITGYSPQSAGPGSFVTINGYYLGNQPGKVYFSRVANPNQNNLGDWVEAQLAPCSFSGWNDRQIIVVVPTGVVSGPLMVVTAPQIGIDGQTRIFTDTTRLENLPDFNPTNQALPGICGVSPSSGTPGANVVIVGKQFGLMDNASDYVQFGTLKGVTNPGGWQDTQINSIVPNLEQGFVSLSVFANGLESNRVQFEVGNGSLNGAPTISSITPQAGPAGTYITILGSNFGNTRGQVWFKATANSPAINGDFSFPAACSATDVWKNDQIIVKFPKNVGNLNQDYYVQVKPANAQSIASALSTVHTFTLTAGSPAPGVCKIDPLSGAVPFTGASVATLYGEYFQVGNVFNTIPQNGLLHYYSFDQASLTNNSAGDAAPGGIDATIVGSPTMQAGVHENAISFTAGSNQYATVPAGGGLNGLNSGTIGFWVRWHGLQSQDAQNTQAFGSVLARQEDAVFSNLVISLDNADPNRAHVAFRALDGVNAVITSKKVVGNDVWHHVAVTYANGTFTLYVDGKAEGQASPQGLLADRPNIPLLIGRWLKTAGAAIDDLVIYNQALNAQQIASLVSAGGAAEVYFWKTGANTSTIAGRSSATVLQSNGISIQAQPQSDVASGPVVLYRPADQSMSNGVPFSVLNCVKNNNMCGDPALKCCTSGADAGACKQPQDLCAGEIRTTGYTWRFSTKDVPAIPHVVERCDDNGGPQGMNTIPTPSPSILWKIPSLSTSTDSQYNVCRTALSFVEFSTKMDQVSVNGNVGVYKCTAFNADDTCRTWTPVVLDNSSFTLMPAAQGNNVASHYLAIKPAAARWDDGALYQVVLGTGLRSAPGPSGGIALAADKPCNGSGINNSAYCFSFRTDSQDCRLRSVLVTPYQYYTTYLESPMLQHNPDGSVGRPVPYAGNGLSTQRCIMMDMSAYQWLWSAEKPNNVTFADISGQNNLRIVNVSSIQNTVGAVQNDKVDISAQASLNGDSKTGVSPLTIDLTNPEVVEAWPTCLEACTNAEVGARFNITLSNKNLPGAAQNGTVQLLECSDENCLATVPVLDTTQVFLDASTNYTVLKIANSRQGAVPLKPNTKYKVVLSTVAQPQQNSPNQIWTSYIFNDPSPQNAGVPYNKQYTWSFRTKASTCLISKVDVQPNDYISTSVGDRSLFSATPYSAPDACSARGQKLDPWSVNWQWVSNDPNPNVAKLYTFGTRKPAAYCTASCVRKGSDVPAGSAILPVCGNGVVEAGEDCDAPNAAKRCGLDCRYMGNPDQNTCGNGVLDRDANFAQTGYGEQCDPQNAQTKVGCTNDCRHAGSSQTPNPNDPSLSICGNGAPLGSGEDCDFGITGDPLDATSAMGCSNTCQHIGTRLSRAWCFINGTSGNASFGGFLQKDYDAACMYAFSVCGDGITEPDEDVGCDTNLGWNSNLCDNHCILKTGDAAADIANGNSCGQDPNNPPAGCNSSLQHIGSNVLYQTPSVCGDATVGVGEDATCESNLVGSALNVNPWVVAEAVGQGPVDVNKTPPEQNTTIKGSTSDLTQNNITVTGKANYHLVCGYHTDAECQAIDPSFGVGTDTCCYAKPRLLSTYPAKAQPILKDVCPNTVIEATFAGVLNPDSIAANILLAEGRELAAPGSLTPDCSVDATSLIATAGSEPWYKRAWSQITLMVRRLLGAANAKENFIPGSWCYGSTQGTVEVANDTPTTTRITYHLAQPLKTDTDYAVIFSAAIKDENGVSIGTQNNKAINFQFNTGSEICRVAGAKITPDTVYFTRPNKAAKLRAVATSVSGQLIQATPNVYNWEYHWGPIPNAIVTVEATTTDSVFVTSSNKNGSVTVFASAYVLPNRVGAPQGVVATGHSNITVFLCENPWPPFEQSVNGSGPYSIFPYEDVPGNNDYFNTNLNGGQFDNTTIPPTQGLTDGYFNFRTFYCADAGVAGTADDLPMLRPAVQTTNAVLTVLPNVCAVTGDTCNSDTDCGTIQTSVFDGVEFIATNGQNQYCTGDNGKPAGFMTYVDANKRSISCNDTNECLADQGFRDWMTANGYSAECTGVAVGKQLACYQQRPLKRFLLASPNGDTIGIQVLENKDYLSAAEWFNADSLRGGRGFSGNLASGEIDGYPSVNDGNNYYIEALNYASSTSNGQIRKNLFGTIYLLSINANAQQSTRAVFDQIRKNFTLNANLSNYRYCGTSLSNPGFVKECRNDFDCALEPSGNICANQKDKIERNYFRYKDINAIQSSLAAYQAKTGTFPDMASGSFLNGQTLSVWDQSWTLMGSQVNPSGPPLPRDPVNILGAAGTCASSTNIFCQSDGVCGNKPNTNIPDTCLFHDSVTGWSADNRRFSFACSTTSLAYRYVYSKGDYKLYLKTEDVGVPVDNLNALINNFVVDPARLSLNGQFGICTGAAEISSIEAGRCGDGVVNINKGEKCDPPGTNRFGACNALIFGQMRVEVCDTACQWVPSSTQFVSCSYNSRCGNGIKEAGEMCDEGKTLNGQVNHCKATCDGYVGNTCANHVADQGELCEVSDIGGLDGWCVGGAYGSNHACDPANGNDDCNSNGSDSTSMGVCVSVKVGQPKYGISRILSCGFDCKSRGPHCGDGVVQAQYGEECDGAQACRLQNSPGVRQCNDRCRWEDTTAALWLRFSENYASQNNDSETYKNAGSVPSLEAQCARSSGHCAVFNMQQDAYAPFVEFDPARQSRLAVSHDPKIMATSSFTIVVRIKPTAYGVAYNRILEKGGFNVGAGYGIEFNVNQKIRFSLWRSGSNAVSSLTSLDSTSTIPLNKWTNIAVSYQNQGLNGKSVQTMKLYVDGYLQNTRTDVGQMPLFSANTNALIIGGGSDPNSNVFFTGGIDELKYYGRALADVEVLDEVQNVNFCQANVQPNQIAIGSGVCGDGKVDDQTEACDTGAQNGVTCNPLYGKSCSYCSKDCTVATVQPLQFCGNGVIEKNEVCDTDFQNNIIVMAASSTSSTLAQYDVQRNGWQALACVNEIADPNSAHIGTKVCSNNCTQITNRETGALGCIICGEVKQGGETISGEVYNVLQTGDSNSDNPLYASAAPPGSISLVYFDPTQGINNGFGVGLRNYATGFDNGNVYTIPPLFANPNAPENAFTSNKSVRVGSNPLCSAPNVPQYAIRINADAAPNHQLPFVVAPDPRNLKPWRYDLILSPIVPKNGYDNSIVLPNDSDYADNYAYVADTSQTVASASARPNDIRVVVRWEGDGALVAGVQFEKFGVSSTESNMVQPVTGRFYSRNKLGWKTFANTSLGYWYHGQTDSGNGSHALAFTFDTWKSVRSDRMPVQHAFYVRTADNSPIKNFTGRNLRVEVHYPDEQGTPNTFSAPFQTFYLDQAQGSANNKATYWHVMNITRADYGEGQYYDNPVDPQTQEPQPNGRIVTGKNQILFTKEEELVGGGG